MPKKKTQEEFVEQIKNLTNGEYKVLGKYEGNRNPVLLKHDIECCGHEFLVRPYHFLAGSRCPKCAGNLKKTTQQYKDEVYNLVGEEYSVLGEYISAHSKILIKHNVCDYEWNVDANSFLKGVRCPNCYGNVKKTHEQFLNEVYKLVGDEYEVLGTYVNSKTKIDILHKICNTVSNIEPSRFLSEKGCCSTCAGNKRKTTEEFKKEIYELEGNNYILLSEYINNNTYVKIKHNIDTCGYEYMVKPTNFLSGNRCPKCAGHNRTTEEYKKIVFNLEGNNYDILGEYVNTSQKILTRHNVCGYEWEIAPNRFMNGNRCPKCNGGISITHDEFVERIYNLCGDEYKVLGKYINTSTPVLMKHNIKECGIEWEVYPDNFLNKGTRCPSCSRKGENSGTWKGGITTINNFLRSVIEEWKYSILNKYNYRCAITGKIGTQKIHHLYGFNLLVEDTLKELNFDKKVKYSEYTPLQLKQIRDVFLEKHTEDIGICICKEIHDLFHKLYGRKNNTPEQFEEFKTRLKLGEFNDFLEENNLKLII